MEKTEEAFDGEGVADHVYRADGGEHFRVDIYLQSGVYYMRTVFHRSSTPQ